MAIGHAIMLTMSPNSKPTNNRLTSTMIGKTKETYQYDLHGNMTQMPHLPQMTWDFKDQLTSTQRQVVNNGSAETTYYVYDATGQRVRKVTESSSGTRRKERIYLGGYEIYREFGSDGNTVNLERQTLHVMDDKHRIALVETRTQGDDGSSEQFVRYQFSNQLDSATLELDDQGQIITYEEYYPYGSTSYQAVRSQTETPKRYRFTGKERDEENELSYHGARYYAPWLGRWTACDPAGAVDGLNLYLYVGNSPTTFHDPSGKQETSPVAQIGNKMMNIASPIVINAMNDFSKRVSFFREGAKIKINELIEIDNQSHQLSLKQIKQILIPLDDWSIKSILYYARNYTGKKTTISFVNEEQFKKHSEDFTALGKTEIQNSGNVIHIYINTDIFQQKGKPFTDELLYGIFNKGEPIYFGTANSNVSTISSLVPPYEHSAVSIFQGTIVHEIGHIEEWLANKMESEYYQSISSEKEKSSSILYRMLDIGSKKNTYRKNGNNQ